MEYNFLILSLLFLPPGILVWAQRPDLRPVIHRMALVSLPFAATESLFTPTYWAPNFLFDLNRFFGFGIEDVLFVVGLGAFTATGYPFVFRRRWVVVRPGSVSKRMMVVGGGVAAGVALAAAVGVPMIYGAPIIMLGMSAAIWIHRSELAIPSLLSGVVSLVVYTTLCALYQWLLPQVFELTWNTEQFLNLYLWGIPVEELIYGFAAGVGAPSFYGAVWGSATAPTR